ncbi:Ser/Thr protein phosphatase protein [Pseudomonas amygdali pv. eriobotryae]|uniref:Histidine/lysine/arginine/ornithine transport system permease protein HisM n=5 Tax=Pseudomonas syringae group genomosp. 2 TaxID=251698 RepID=A0A3M3WWY3_PSEA0|nr:Ser/Thr protein phosphatase protein [Pseudomonas amygdali pv. eriobotryae]
MIELLQEYWKPFLYTDGVNITGLAMTMWLLSASIAIGFCVSIPLSIARVSKNRWVRWPVQFYTYLFRGTPLYIQLLICYTGIYSIAAVREQPMLDAFFRDAMNCTILAFTLNTCAYTTEIFAGAIRSMAHGEVEAAKAYGLTGWKLYAYVIMPSVLRRSLPYYSNEVILMLHSTTVAFTATVPDILKVARDANSATFMTFQSFGIAAVMYLTVTFILVGLFRLAERRWLAFLGDSAYEFTLTLNRWLNHWRAKYGYGYWSLSAYLKHKVKSAVNFISDFEEAIAHECVKRGLDGVVCGHIHHAEIRQVGGVEYLNCGDWVESCTALIEHLDGTIELFRLADAHLKASQPVVQEPVSETVA